MPPNPQKVFPDTEQGITIAKRRTRRACPASRRKGVDMGFDDKARNKAEELKGTAKEKYGDATDNESLEAEGAAERADARTRQAGEHIKDAGRDVRDAFRS
jgi:uncharacterized protein YjbJ (UPF0337 family)